jgi:hypothetical protein
LQPSARSACRYSNHVYGLSRVHVQTEQNEQRVESQRSTNTASNTKQNVAKRGKWQGKQEMAANSSKWE